MLDQQINEHLGLLQKELSRLKSATDYIDGAKENSTSIIAELEKVQQNYAAYTDKIFNLYKQYISDLKQNTQIQINDGVLKFETTGNQIDTTNKEKLLETNRLL
jgi:CII-binding regulator of phage lambda lysogenization HflD